MFRCRLFPGLKSCGSDIRVRADLLRQRAGWKESCMDESTLIAITRPSDNQSLCRTCYWAHAQKGFRESEEVIFCAFGPMRKVLFKVRDCTDYLNRTVPTRAQMESIALIIPTEVARKRAGFSGSGFNSESDEEEVASQME
jgi:hypothetical protein